MEGRKLYLVSILSLLTGTQSCRRHCSPRPTPMMDAPAAQANPAAGPTGGGGGKPHGTPRPRPTPGTPNKERMACSGQGSGIVAGLALQADSLPTQAQLRIHLPTVLESRAASQWRYAQPAPFRQPFGPKKK